MNAVRTTRTRTSRTYPNAADRRYFLDKLTDSILAAAICAGVVAIVFFLITMI